MRWWDWSWISCMLSISSKISDFIYNILGLIEMGDINSPGSCFEWVMTLFASKFFISCLRDSVFSSLKKYWNEVGLGSDMAVLICLFFTVWRNSGSDVSGDHSVWDCDKQSLHAFILLLKMLFNFFNIIYREIRLRRKTVQFFDLWNCLLNRWLLFWINIGSFM